MDRKHMRNKNEFYFLFLLEIDRSINQQSKAIGHAINFKKKRRRKEYALSIFSNLFMLPGDFEDGLCEKLPFFLN